MYHCLDVPGEVILNDSTHIGERINKLFGNMGSAIAIETTANQTPRVIFQKVKQTTEDGVATWTVPLVHENRKLDTTTWYPAVAHGIIKVDGQSLNELRTHIERTNKVELAYNPRPLNQTTVDKFENHHYSVRLFFKKAQDMINQPPTHLCQYGKEDSMHPNHREDPRLRPRLILILLLLARNGEWSGEQS